MDMGTASFLSTKIPVLGHDREVVDEPLTVNGRELTVTCVSMGNPHCVVPVNTLSKDLAVAMGPWLENHPMFPNRTNVQFMRVIDRDNLQIEIWERGAGYTLASGSSSCAAAAAFRLGLTGNSVTVHMPGGSLDIVIRDNYAIQMTGPVVFVSKGVFSDEIFD